MNEEPLPRWFPALVAACVVAGGVSGLVYEVVWARMLSVFVGATAAAHGIVLASFMAGLALGNATLGRLVDRYPRHALAIYAGLEALVGIYGLLSPSLYRAGGAAFEQLTAGSPPESSLFVPKLLLASAFVILPTMAMGGTLPALCRFIVRRIDHVGQDVARLYLLNTVGAVFGVVLGGLWLVPKVGAANAAYIAAIGNLAAALACGVAALALRSPAGLEALETPTDVAAPPPPATAGQRLWLGIAAMTGFGSLVLEVAWVRVFAMVFGSSSQAFTLMLSAFISGIAVGSAWAGRRLSRGADPARLVVLWLAVSVVLLTLQIPLYERLPFWQFKMAQALERRADVYPIYLACQALLAFAWMMPSTIATGAALPTIVAAYTRRVDDVGGSVGALFAANTAGTVVGPVVATFVLMPAIGLRGTVGCSILVFALAALVVELRLVARAAGRPWWGAPGGRWRLAAIGFASLGSMALPDWDGSEMHAGGFRRWTLEPGADFAEFVRTRHRSEVLYELDGVADSVVVVENRQGRRFMKVNGKTDASDFEDLPTQRMVAHLPLLLQRQRAPGQPRDVFVVGVGSGATVGAAAMHPDAEVVAVDISEGILQGSRFFDHINYGYAERDNVEVHQGDAREWLRRDPRRWDVLINQPSNPWIAGNAALFSQEFFEMARARLDEGGVFAQWMHVYAMDEASVDLVMNTFASVFPHVTVWWPQGVDLLLIGTNEPLPVDRDALAAALDEAALGDEMASYEREGVRLTSAERVLALQVMSEAGFRDAFPGSEPHTTDLWPRLEFQAPVAQFVGQRTQRFVELDERLVPGTATRLHLAQVGWTPALRADLLAFFGSRDTPFSQQLAGSLEHAVAGVPSDADVMPGFVTRATGLPLILERWQQLVVDASAPSVATCDAYANAVAQSLPARATVFHRPGVTGFVAALERCADAHPERALVWDAQTIELLVATGHGSRAVPRIDALLRLQPGEAATAELEALRARALATDPAR